MEVEDDDDDSDSETPQITIVYKNKREQIDAFKALLKDKKVPSTAAWPQVMKLIQKDPRFNALKALNEKKQAWNAWKTQRAKEEREEASKIVYFYLIMPSFFVLSVCTELIKIQGERHENHWHPPLQPKPLGRIGSFFG